MTNNIIIIVGQYRNEKSSTILGPLVAEELKRLGYQVRLFENPEKRTPREIGLEAFKEGRRMKRKELEKILCDWGDSVCRQYQKIPIFEFHEYVLNPTEFVPEEELKEELNSIERFCKSFDLGDFKGDDLAHKVKFFGDCQWALIETPSISGTSLPEDQLRALKKVFHPRTFKIFCSYFLDTDLEESKKQGFLSQKMVEILAKGIDYLIQNKI